MDKEERTNRAAKLKLTLARRNKTMYNKKRRKNDEGYPPKKYVKNKNVKISHNQSTTTVAAIDADANIDRYDSHSDDDFEKDDDVGILLNGNSIKNDFSLHGYTSINSDVHHQNASENHIEGYQESNSISKHLNSAILMNKNEHDNMNRIEEEKNANMSMSERVFNWVKKYHAMNKVITDAGSVALGGSVSCNQVKRSVLIPRNNVVNIDTEDEDDNDSNDNNNHNNNNYNNNNNNNNINGDGNGNGNNKNSNNSNNTARSDNNNDKIKEKNSSVLPLFFQHQGHSRTIIGTESF